MDSDRESRGPHAQMRTEIREWGAISGELYAASHPPDNSDPESKHYRGGETDPAGSKIAETREPGTAAGLKMRWEEQKRKAEKGGKNLFRT